MTPAERLLKAAELLEKRASEATEGPWQADDRCVYAGDHGHLAHVSLEEPYGDSEADARYIATVHPGIAMAIVLALRSASILYERREAEGQRPERTLKGLLHVADLLLAGEQ